jgi:SAM-dependent methyltransferase/uncharacterized protein YbaR (Trm112 family)
MDVREQIATGKLVCPRSKKRLFLDEKNSCLITDDKSAKYPLLNGSIPILLADQEWADEYTSSSSAEKEPYPAESESSILGKLKTRLLRDHRTNSSVAAFTSVIASAPEDALCLSIGGGPDRKCPNLVNLNIEPFPGVDVVADAHFLPYADESVDAIFCEAVLEHLYDPGRAVSEMYRVLKAGGKLLAITPFLQPYHGYPHHYQNFTLRGHMQLFISKHFEISESGTCVGPTFAIVVLNYKYIEHYVPLGKLLSKIYGVIAVLFTPLDRLLNDKSNAHILASTTYVVAKKAIAN